MELEWLLHMPLLVVMVELEYNYCLIHLILDKLEYFFDDSRVICSIFVIIANKLSEYSFNKSLDNH